MWPAVLPVYYSVNLTFWLTNGPKKVTPYNYWFKSNLNLGESYKVTYSKY